MTADREKDERDKPKVCVLTEFSTHQVGGIVGALRIRYVQGLEQIGQRGQLLQIHLSAPQCLEIEEALTKLGKSLHSPPSGKTQ